MFHKGDIGNGRVDDGFSGDRLATTASFISCDDNSASTIEDSLSESLGAESGKDHRVYGAYTCTSEERSGGLPGHGKVNGDRVALLNAE